MLDQGIWVGSGVVVVVCWSHQGGMQSGMLKLIHKVKLHELWQFVNVFLCVVFIKDLVKSF